MAIDKKITSLEDSKNALLLKKKEPGMVDISAAFNAEVRRLYGEKPENLVQFDASRRRGLSNDKSITHEIDNTRGKLVNLR